MYFFPNTERIAHGFVCYSWIKNCRMGLLLCSGNAVRPLVGNTSAQPVTPSGILFIYCS